MNAWVHLSRFFLSKREQISWRSSKKYCSAVGSNSIRQRIVQQDLMFIYVFFSQTSKDLYDKWVKDDNFLLHNLKFHFVWIPISFWKRKNIGKKSMFIRIFVNVWFGLPKHHRLILKWEMIRESSCVCHCHCFLLSLFVVVQISNYFRHFLYER